jgi:hypothetical protein
MVAPCQYNDRTRPVKEYAYAVLIRSFLVQEISNESPSSDRGLQSTSSPERNMSSTHGEQALWRTDPEMHIYGLGVCWIVQF